MDLSHIIDPQSPEACSSYKVAAVKHALQNGILNEEQPLALIYNLTQFRRHFQAVLNALPSNIFLHCMAVKGNPVLPLMKIAADVGVGFEAASMGELTQAFNTGVDTEKIVFDSPVKTKAELKLALEKGVMINADNFQEMERVTELVNTNQYKNVKFGLRLNPQVGVGSIKEMSTSGLVSKFGVSLSDYETEIFHAYKQRPWMNSVHVHIGSQGIPIEMNLSGIRKIMDIVNQINEHAGTQQIKYVDIGGGLPVNFNDESVTSAIVPSIEEYAKQLKERVPELFSGKFRVITEYGRIYNAKPGFIVSRVEYNKVSGGRHIALVHAGADLLVRTVWAPKSWALRITALTSTGDINHSDKRASHDIGGPCCYAGDVIAHERMLPLLHSGDWIIIHDTGGYFLSAYSYFNSRQAPPIYGFEEGPDSNTITDFHLIKKGQTPQETVAFFA